MSFWLASRAMDNAVLPSCEDTVTTRPVRLWPKAENGKGGETCNAYVIRQRGVAAWHRQQLTHDVHVTVLAGAHERRGAVVIPDVDLRPAGQQRPHHVSSAVADGEHQGGLTGLRTQYS